MSTFKEEVDAAIEANDGLLNNIDTRIVGLDSELEAIIDQIRASTEALERAKTLAQKAGIE